jgi:PHD/YefM family antitoxin component YafN of YafNO toxin-antitoxin module
MAKTDTLYDRAIIKQGMPSLKAEEELEHLQTAETVYQAKTEKRDEILAQLAQEVTREW